MSELDFNDFCEVNEEELSTIFAETGADRELDFDRERNEERIYNNKSIYPQLIRIQQ